MTSAITGEMPDDSTRVVTELVRGTFDRASGHFDDPDLFFWDACGIRTVELAGLRPGERVLDVCCGTGASALPAAAAVGSSGRVLGVDLSARQLGLARAKARTGGRANTVFAVGDLRCPPVDDGTQDAVVCVLGIYFARDVAGALAGLWRRVAPGGVLAVTTWGARALEPANGLYLDAVRQVRPELCPSEPSWVRINSVASLTRAFVAAGIPAPEVDEATIRGPTGAEAFWRVVLGSGYRLLLDLMGPDSAARVWEVFRHEMDERRVETVTADVLYARVRRSLTTA